MANATTVRRMDKTELVSRAQLIVHGTVISNEVVYDDGPSGPANVRTLTTIEVIETLKGEAATTVTVAGFGGQVGDLIYNWPGIPKFEVGEETIVLLSKPVPNGPGVKSLFAPLGRDDAYMVTGLSQGRYEILNDADRGKVAVRSDEGLEFAGEAAVGTKSNALPLNEVMTEIEAIVETQRAANAPVENAGGGK